MAISMEEEASQGLSQTAIVTGYPFTVALWFYPTGLSGNYGLWSLTNSVDQGHFLRYNDTQLSSYALDSGGFNFATCEGAVVPSKWNFALLRHISSTNRRLSGLSAAGDIVHAQNTVSRTPSGINSVKIAAEVTFTGAGSIAEYWFANVDVQEDGAQLQNSLFLQLAHCGPFSVPRIVKNIIEYRSFRKHPICGELGEVYWGRFGIQQWTDNNGVTIGPHPPLSQEYVRPGQRKLALVV